MPKRYRVTSHWGPLLLTACMLLLLIYFILDTFVFVPWRHVSLWPATVFGVIGLGAAGLGWHLGRAAPSTERLGVALMLGTAVALALWPASLRINAIGADERRELVVYSPLEPGVYEVVEEDYPDIRLFGNTEYWDLIHDLGQYRFYLIRGPLGFWQIDYRPIREDIRFYDAIMNRDRLNGAEKNE